MIILTMLLGSMIGFVAGIIGWLAFGIGFSGAAMIYIGLSLGGAGLGVMAKLLLGPSASRDLMQERSAGASV